MPRSALIRVATVEDVEPLAHLYRSTLRDAYAGTAPADFMDPVSEQARATKLLTAMLNGTRTWLVAVAGEQVVGGCALTAARDTDLPAHAGEIATMAVLEQHRRHGHGVALLNAARMLAVQRGWCALVLWVVESNVHARAFYASADFEADGGIKVDDRLGFSAPLVRYRATRL